MTQHTNSLHNYDIAQQTTVLNTSKQNTQDDTLALPSLYEHDGRLNITARRNAVKARMRDDGTALEIWNSRIGVDLS